MIKVKLVPADEPDCFYLETSDGASRFAQVWGEENARQLAEAWNRRAQPAEAEGVEDVQVMARVHHNDEHAEPVRAVLNSIGRQMEDDAKLMAVAQHERIVSVVTAERDQLRADRDRLQEEMAELWKRIDNFQSQSHGIPALAEIERLRAEVEALRKDAVRLDRLDIECEAYGCEGIHEGNRWMIDGPFRTVRDAIDAAMAAKGA